MQSRQVVLFRQVYQGGTLFRYTCAHSKSEKQQRPILLTFGS
jgi:hypothetical protein